MRKSPSVCTRILSLATKRLYPMMVQKYDRGTLVLLGRYRFMVQSKKGRRGDDVLTAFRPNGVSRIVDMFRLQYSYSLSSSNFALRRERENM